MKHEQPYSQPPSPPLRPFLSVVIPVLNEREMILPLLRQLREAPGVEIIVADGGSVDGTPEVVEKWAQVVAAPKGRARQMNVGARLAGGDILWFLHADSVLPVNACEQVLTLMEDERYAGGCFRLSIPERGLPFRLCAGGGNLGVDILRLTCGDHGIFIRRSVFKAIGGFPEVPLMEDVELYRRMRRFGRVRQLRSAIQTSPRRWTEHGPWRVTGIYLLIWALYLGGADMKTLERVYRRVK